MRVVISVVRNGSRFLIVRRAKPISGLQWHFPGGKQKTRESEQHAAERETLEETSIVCKAVEKIGERVHPQTNVNVSYWICEYVSGQPKAKYDEVGDLRWVTGKEALQTFTTDVYKPLATVLDVSKPARLLYASKSCIR
jgi:8-oxo-dGTP pyrophosphatase MutT (NUDIX family)